MRTVEPYTPLQYIVGKTVFLGCDIIVNEDVLIPRPETELLVQVAIDLVYNLQLKTYNLDMLDLCTGSGCIAIALTKELPDCRIVASDISEGALDVAGKNAILNGVSGRIEFIKSDLFEKVRGRFDLIVTNPPYVARDEFATLQKEVLREPHIALDGGHDGLDFYRRIIEDAPGYLNEDGYLLMEIGHGHRKGLEDILKSHNFKVCKIRKDFNGIDRIITAKWINS